MSEESDPRLYHAHVARNREPILEVLRRVLPPRGLVLEVASGSGEHAAYFAKRLPTLLWQPTDPDPRALASITGHRTAADAPNLLPPLWLDAMSEEWPVQRADALVCINMIHITPWEACKGLMTGAERTLRSGGVLYLYGPYQIDGRHTAQSNEDFDGMECILLYPLARWRRSFMTAFRKLWDAYTHLSLVVSYGLFRACSM